jgi:glycolate oxidase
LGGAAHALEGDPQAGTPQVERGHRGTAHAHRDLLDRTDDIGRTTGVRNLAYGHAGDGNLHVNFLWDDDGERPAVERAIGLLMQATVEMGGTLSGEHGIGVSKAQYLPLEQSEGRIALQRDVKRAFDPRGLLNPGKIFPSGGHRAC